MWKSKLVSSKHHYMCQYHPSNADIANEIWNIPHRDGTILGWFKWFFCTFNCDVKVSKLQETLDRL